MSDQLQGFISEAQKIIPEPPATGDQPKVPFVTGLKLTGAQEKKMLDWAFDRLRQLANDSGRNQTAQPTWWLSLAPGSNTALASQGLLPSNTFLAKRSRFDATYYNDVSWRPWSMGPQTIFASSNMTAPISRRICRQMQARAKNSFFGSDPWFSCDPAPQPASEIDQDLAREVERFSRFKLKESDSKGRMGRAIDRALVLGECAVKTSYVVRDQIFNTEARVLVDIEGQPIKTSNGDTIHPDDEIIDSEDGRGTQVYKKDPNTVAPLAPIFEDVPLDRRQVLFEGAISEPIFYKDFLCTLTAPSVQEAECCIHLYDKQVIEFVNLVVKRGMVDDSDEDRKAASSKLLACVKQISNNSPMAKSASTREQRPNENYAPLPETTYGGPIAEFAEFYIWYDANEDGVAENIMLIADRNTQQPIYYDHVANVTTDGLRPIEIVRINPIEGRWYGMGIMELFESYQTTIDLLLNRWNFSQSRSGRIDLWTPTNTQEGDRDPNLKMNWGQSYTKKPGVKKEDVLESIYLDDTKFEKLHEQMQFFMQLAMNESGVMNANDGKTAGLGSSDLATGIIQIEKSGDELFMPIIEDLTPCLTRILDREVDVTLANMNPEEAYTFMEGEDLQIATLTPDQVRGLKYKVSIDLSTHKNQQMIQLSGQAAMLVEKFYALLPQVQVHVAPFYRDQLRVLSPKSDADSVIQVVDLGLGGNVTQMPGQQAPKPKTGGAGAMAPAQLIQKTAQPSGQSAPGGTPAAA